MTSGRVTQSISLQPSKLRAAEVVGAEVVFWMPVPKAPS